jgi:hypothetical protein
MLCGNQAGQQHRVADGGLVCSGMEAKSAILIRSSGSAAVEAFNEITPRLCAQI